MVDELKKAGVRMERLRKDSLPIDNQEIADRVVKFHNDANTARTEDMEMRIQRYAKFRGWTQGRDWIGEETSDVALPDMMTSSLRVQDTLHNAVMATRPAVESKAINRNDQEKQDNIDGVIDYQVFSDMNGERFIEELAEDFVNGGDYTVFIPWVREEKKVVDIREYPEIPEGMVPLLYFKEIINSEFQRSEVIQIKDGWDWKIKDEQSYKVSFYTKKDKTIEMVQEKMVKTFDGPRPIVKDYEDVLYPVRAANLQAPSPSNPGGAAYVILKDYPSTDEIRRLSKNGFYDLISDDDLEKIANVEKDNTEDQIERQKDRLAGKNDDIPNKEKSHKPLTRLTCFDLFDIDDDGLDEEVIWWVILETKTLLKAKKQGEIYPFNPPRRPLAEASFLPVKGRKAGISLLEMMEGTHDLMKQVLDQTIDWGTLTTAPFGFYRPSSSVKQEVMRLFAGELYPLQNPREDVHFPVLPNQSQAFGFNLFTLGTQMQEKLTNVGDLQLGRVPTGKASALRTVSGVQTILGQGEARPERILRRFFMGLVEVWKQIHELNQEFLPDEKKFRIMGYQEPGQDPYSTIKDRAEIKGRFDFDFKANVLNTSKAALAQSLGNMAQMYLSPLVLQMGLMNAEGAYRLLKDVGRADGGDPEKYLLPPSPDANKMPMQAEEAISMMVDNQIPNGSPEEGAMQHFQKLQQFMQSDDFAYLDTTGVQIFDVYIRGMKKRAEQEMQQQQLIAAAQQGQPQGPPQAQSQGEPQGNPQVQNNELLDESLTGGQE